MKDFPHSSNPRSFAAHGRRDFISRSLLAGGSLMLVAESRGNTPLAQNDDRDIAKTVGLADSIALYGGLLEDARRLILQKDAQLIYIAKYEATEWLAHTTSQAERFRSMLAQGAALTEPQNQELKTFLSDVDFGGKEISKGLIRMRQEPLEQIKNLDTDFDKIRGELGTASTALKNGNTSAARTSIVAALERLNKYGGSFSSAAPSTPTTPVAPPTGTGQTGGRSQSQPQQQSQQSQSQSGYRPVTVPSSSLVQLLQTVLDLLNSQSRPQHHANSSNYPVDPALQASIYSVLRSKLKPGTWLQIGIGYAVAFPILLRVSDHNNRLKLLNDALRLVPPGLRDPLLEQLAGDLANLP